MKPLRLYRDGTRITELPEPLRQRLRSAGLVDAESASFVGYIESDSALNVFFPKRFPFNDDIEQQRTDSKLLFDCLSRYSKHYKTKIDQLTLLAEKDEDEARLNLLDAYYFLLQYFRRHGSYKRNFNKVTRGLSGKINWERSFDTIEPLYLSLIHI